MFAYKYPSQATLPVWQDVVQVGVIQGNDTMQALLRLMSNLYAPQFIASSLWPESIKKDFVGELANHCGLGSHA